MIYEKDTTKNTESGKGQDTQVTQKEHIYNKAFSVSVILKKTEKVTTALYMVTDCMPEGEPLITRLRTASLSLVSKMYTLSGYFAEPRYAQVDEITRLFDELSFYIDMGVTLGLVSQMNGSILIAEIGYLQDTLRTQFGTRKMGDRVHEKLNSVILTKDMFAVSETPVLENKNVLYKGQETTSSVLYKKEKEQAGVVRPIENKINIGVKIARRNDVLNIIKAKGTVSIKDIASILKDINEKTIQRELKGLVEEGILEKKGEKRWSMYSLVKS